MAFRTAATLSLLTLSAADAADQCKVKHNTTYANCWGEDLHGEPADSFETCCQRCAEIPRCEVFMFDVWNVSGDAEPFCFFKYGCSELRHSDTAVSGMLHRPSTEKTTKAPKTTHAPTTEKTTEAPKTTRAPTTAPVTTEAPPSTTGAEQPRCTKPFSVAGIGAAKAQKRLNVSSWEDCCSSCAEPACSYVTSGKYTDAAEETWACFHFSEPVDVSAAAPVHASGEFLTLRDDDEKTTCKDLGLKGCTASPVSMSPGPLPGPSASPSVAALGAVGAGVFLVTIPIGYFVTMKLGLGGR